MVSHFPCLNRSVTVAINSTNLVHRTATAGERTERTMSENGAAGIGDHARYDKSSAAPSLSRPSSSTESEKSAQKQPLY